ncbi:MAG: hypothetical protein WBJ52_07265 [Methanoregulaceae archaeon]
MCTRTGHALHRNPSPPFPIAARSFPELSFAGTSRDIPARRGLITSPEGTFPGAHVALDRIMVAEHRQALLVCF